MIGPKVKKWLMELLDAAAQSPRPTPWELNFLANVRSRFERYGDDLTISDKQMAVLNRIDEKIHAAG